MHELGGESHHCEVEPDQSGCRQRVGDAALEDQVGVHQAVAHDGPGEGEREKEQRDSGELGGDVGNGDVGQKGNGGEQREGRDGDNGATGKPLQLLPAQRRVGVPIAGPEYDGSEHIKRRLVTGEQLIETMTKYLGCRPVHNGEDMRPTRKAPGT